MICFMGQIHTSVKSAFNNYATVFTTSGHTCIVIIIIIYIYIIRIDAVSIETEQIAYRV